MSTPAKVSLATATSRISATVAGLRKAAQSSEIPPVSDDPDHKGTVTPPKTEGDNKPAGGIPVDGGKNTPGDGAVPIAQPETKPGSPGENVPVTPKNGDAVDAAQSGGSLDAVKAASRAQAIAKSMRSVVKAAAAPAAPAAPAAAAPAPAAAAPAAPAVKEAGAGSPNAQLAAFLQSNPSALIKLAVAIVETDEGLTYATRILEKQSSVADARRLADEVTTEYQQLVGEELQLLEMQKAAADQQAQIAAHIQAKLDAATPEERVKIASVYDEYFAQMVAIENETEAMVKSASASGATAEEIEQIRLFGQMEKVAFDQGAAEGAMMEDSGAAEAIPGGDGEPTMEQLLGLVQELIASGQIDEQTGMAIAEALTAEAGGAAPGGAEGGAPGGEGGAPEPDGDEAAAAEAAATEGMPAEKAASVKATRSLADQILAG